MLTASVAPIAQESNAPLTHAQVQAVLAQLRKAG
ncbi:DUF4148 domain-containing protein [Paraburkholderia sediminicola]